MNAIPAIHNRVASQHLNKAWMFTPLATGTMMELVTRPSYAPAPHAPAAALVLGSCARCLFSCGRGCVCGCTQPGTGCQQHRLRPHFSVRHKWCRLDWRQHLPLRSLGLTPMTAQGFSCVPLALAVQKLVPVDYIWERCGWFAGRACGFTQKKRWTHDGHLCLVFTSL